MTSVGLPESFCISLNKRIKSFETNLLTSSAYLLNGLKLHIWKINVTIDLYSYSSIYSKFVVRQNL